MENIYEDLLLRAKAAGTSLEEICRNKGYIRRTITQWRYGVPKAVLMYIGILEEIERAETTSPATSEEQTQKQLP